MTGFRLEHLSLVDFRCFDRLELDFHPEITLLVGPNARGKSAVLDALVIGLPAVVAEVRSPVLRDEDVRLEVAPDGSLRPRPRCGVSVTAYVGGNREKRGISKVVGAPKDDSSRPGRILPRPPLVAAYPDHRRVSGGAQPLATAHPAPHDWWHPAAFWTELVTWFRRETLADLQQGTKGPALAFVRERVVRALSDCGVNDLYYDIRSEGLHLAFRGERLRFDAASAGTRAIVSLVADLATRSWLRSQGEDEFGLVLIDEVELHLHPEWQRRFLPALRVAFPQVQLVATTHSPQVVGSVAAECVRILDAGVVRTVDRTQGRDANTVLEDVFDVPPRDPDAKAELDELLRMVDAREPEALTRLVEAEERYGRDDPDVARARFEYEMGG